jgi:hypothetical protein
MLCYEQPANNLNSVAWTEMILFIGKIERGTMLICNSEYANHLNTIFILLLSSSVFGNNSIHHFIQFAMACKLSHEQYRIIKAIKSERLPSESKFLRGNFRIECWL